MLQKIIKDMNCIYLKMYSLSCFSIVLLFIDRDVSLCVLDFKSGCRLNICCQNACVCVCVMITQETEALLSKGLVFVSGVCGALFVPSIY